MSKRFAGIAVVAALAGAFWAARETRAGLAAQHALQSFFKPYSMVTTLAIDGVGDVPLFVNPDDQVITPWLWAGRVWEETETHWFVQSLRPGDVVVDVGANVGYYTVLAGRLVGDAGRVYAFEPDPVSFAIMQRNVRLSGLRNVVLEPKAVSNEPGSIRLFLSEKNKGDHRIYQPEGEQRDFIEVEAVPLDAYFEGVEESVDFVKIDTQGAELVILEGMLDLVKRSGSLVMAIEYSPHHLAGFGATGAELLDVLGSLDLAMFDLGAGGAGLQRIKPVRPRSLLLNFSPKWTSFTNLLLVKGRSDILAKIRSQGPTP